MARVKGLIEPAELDKKAERLMPYDKLPDEYSPEEVVAVPQTDIRELLSPEEDSELETPKEDIREIEEEQAFKQITAE